MSILHQLLGQPFEDNALFVKIDSGKKIFRLLFDCGEFTITALPVKEILHIDHLFLSHFHLDHIAGLDRFIRVNYNRQRKPVHIWGPKQTLNKILHRLRSIEWNLLTGKEAEWYVHEVRKRWIDHYLISPKDHFRKKVLISKEANQGRLLTLPEFSLSAVILNHRIPVLGFKIVESFKQNIDVNALNAFNVKPGDWLNKLKDGTLPDEQKIGVDGKTFTLGYLRQKLLQVQTGESLCYLTDFMKPKVNWQFFLNWLQECQICYCESQYLHEDQHLAQANYHLTTVQAAEIARSAEVQKLIIFHFSQRYKHLSTKKFLHEAQTVFPNTFLPQNWTQ